MGRSFVSVSCILAVILLASVSHAQGRLIKTGLASVQGAEIEIRRILLAEEAAGEDYDYEDAELMVDYDYEEGDDEEEDTTTAKTTIKAVEQQDTTTTDAKTLSTSTEEASKDTTTEQAAADDEEDDAWENEEELTAEEEEELEELIAEIEYELELEDEEYGEGMDDYDYLEGDGDEELLVSTAPSSADDDSEVIEAKDVDTLIMEDDEEADAATTLESTDKAEVTKEVEAADDEDQDVVLGFGITSLVAMFAFVVAVVGGIFWYKKRNSNANGFASNPKYLSVISGGLPTNNANDWERNGLRQDSKILRA